MATATELRSRRSLAVTRLDALPTEAARERIQISLVGEAFREHVGGLTEGDLPLAVLPGVATRVLGSKSHTVRLSQWTAVKQLNRHADVSVDDYRRVQRMLDEGQLFADGNSIVAYFQDGSRWWSAVVKATDAGDELYLVTYHRVAERQLERARRRFTPIG